MPLVKTTLETGIKTTLQNEFKKSTIKESLRKLLDGDGFNGRISSAKNISDALDNIKDGVESVALLPSDVLNPDQAQDLIKRYTCNEWSNAISESVAEWMSKEIAPIIAKTISDQVDTYIKTATIIVQPGIAVATSGGAGSTTAPSAPAVIS